MSTTVALDSHAKRVNEYFDKEAALERQSGCCIGRGC
jgi:hypothetical protein